MQQQSSLTRTVQGLTPNQNDQDVMRIIASRPDKRATGKTIEALCSHNECRPKTLNQLIHSYLQTYGPSKMVPIVNRSLVAFAKNPHTNQRFNDIRKVVMYLRRNGADPFWKDENGKDAVDYAYEGGGSRVLDTLLRFAWSNPIRKVRLLKKREQQRQDSRAYMKHLLQNIEDDFQTQAGFAQARIYTPLMPTRQLNLPQTL